MFLNNDYCNNENDVTDANNKERHSKKIKQINAWNISKIPHDDNADLRIKTHIK